MAQLIDKADVVAEIEKKLADILACKKDVSTPEERIALSNMLRLCKEILSFLNTLEVKEVDLESEIKKIQKEYKTIDEYNGYPATIYANGIERIAKHFFEFGLKAAQKGE